MKKLISTIHIVTTLFLARTFGRYKVSAWNGDFSYAEYEWRGKIWAFPTEPIHHDALNAPTSNGWMGGDVS